MELDPLDVEVIVTKTGVFPNNHCDVQIVHLPTGIVVRCSEHKSEIKNKDQALRELRSLLKNCPDDY